MTSHRYIIKHNPSGDEAEADTKDAAILAARTLLADSGFVGHCNLWEGTNVIDMVWADDETSYTHTSIGDTNA